jgi:hypothetical protein
MTYYLLSTHTVAGEVGEPMSNEQMQRAWQQLQVIEQSMKSAGSWVFSGRLHEPDTATVVRVSDGQLLTTDGPFIEAKEHLGGFYIIRAEDLDQALSFASRVAEAIKKPIEVWPFRDATTT